MTGPARRRHGKWRTFVSDRPLVRLATRASALALWQANHIADRLRAAFPECQTELVHVSTTGDRDQTGPLAALGGWGVFTREVQRAVLDGRADVAVHSLKDLPTEPTQGLVLAAVPERAPVHDVLVLPADHQGPRTLEGLPSGARVGTGSLRRRAQLLHWRPDLQFFEARGNVDTRLRKLDSGEFDALMLAAAGLTRLGFQERMSCAVGAPLVLPAVGQGALGLECRADDETVRGLLAALNDPATEFAVLAERSLLSTLRAGCHAPVGASSHRCGGQSLLQGVVLSIDGRTRLVAERTQSVNSDPRLLGAGVAEDLLQHGAAELLAPR